MFLVVTDVEVVPVDREALSVCVFLVVTDVEVVPMDREALSVSVPCCNRCGSSSRRQ